MKHHVTPLPWILFGSSILLLILVLSDTTVIAGALPGVESPEASFLPDVTRWRRTSYDEAFFRGREVCGEEALNYWMQSASYRADPSGKLNKITQFERLVGGDPAQVAQVNKEIQNECRRVLANAAEWRKNKKGSRNPSFWIIMALRAPDRLTPETHRVIHETLRVLDLGDAASGYIGWMGTPGANGSNVHGYLTPLTLAPALIDDAKARDAGEQALRAELDHMNHTGDVAEFNLLESHWNGTASWEILKRYIPDPRLRRMARMISERLWINRFLTWSSEIERITGPGSRMAPVEWLGCNSERALLATGMRQPIWINFFFPWDGWNVRAFRRSWPLAQTEAAVPDLPAYLQDLAWRKAVPNELQCQVKLKHWRKNYPPLAGVAQPETRGPVKYVNYQGHGYTLGSCTSSWVVNTCVVAACAWWNNSRNTQATLGSPQRFCVLYPHYVFNGMSTFDKGEVYFDDKSGQPLKDEIGGAGGPYLREFIDYGRVGTLQDRNTLLLTYTPKPSTHHAVLVKEKVRRASAAMFLFRWTGGVEGLFVNREPVRSLPRELAPGDWWFIEDGDVYAAVRPLEATRLRGGRTVLEQRTRQIVLYQDNVAADNITGITDADWVKARAGFVVEMGDKSEFGSFAGFQNKILAGKVTADAADGFTRHLAYERDDRRLDMRWHCYTEEYAARRIGGRDDPWTRYAQSPEFAVGDSGRLAVNGAKLQSTAGKTFWLLACKPSKTWVAWQPNVDENLPLILDSPAGRLTCENFPFGKIAVAQVSGGVTLDVDATPAVLKLETKAARVNVRFNGVEGEAIHDVSGVWTLREKASSTQPGA